MALSGLMSFAQEAVARKQVPLHVEASLEAGRGTDKMLSFGPALNLSYCFAQRIALYAVAQSDYYMQENGVTKDFNQTFNVGGGLGCVLWLPKEDGLGTLEFRALAATGCKKSDFRNTAYHFGLYWYGHRSYLFVQPIIGVGYRLNDFVNSSRASFHSGFISFGLRF